MTAYAKAENMSLSFTCHKCQAVTQWLYDEWDLDISIGYYDEISLSVKAKCSGCNSNYEIGIK